MLENFKTLAGYDNHCTVYDAHDYVLRKVVPTYKTQAQDIFALYQKYDLSSKGIVETKLFSSEQDALVLEHKKHIISYPHEWTISMFKEAVMFHLQLLLELDRHDITLKDALPNNILFDFNKPVFVDFLSLVKKENLVLETWLIQSDKVKGDLRYLVSDKMFVPYFLIPFFVVSRREYALARDLLLKRACNVHTQPPSWNDLLNATNSTGRLKGWFQTGKLYRFLNSIRKLDFTKSCQELLTFVRATDVAPLRGGYVAYYDEKKENFSFTNHHQWKNKQKSVYAALSQVKPKRVLDIGANTGWFSLLAVSIGAEVIATDIDESCVDHLYHYAKENNLKILPLLLSFEDFQKASYGFIPTDAVYQGRDFKNNPVFLPATERFKSDAVLCLALVHHLILGSRFAIDYVMKILSDLTVHTLVLEYVGLDDEVIKQDPGFFKSLKNYTETTYNLDLFIQAGLNHFQSFEILDSHPSTRKLLVFKK